MWAKPRPQQRPNACPRMDMHCLKAVAVVIAGVCATAMTDRLLHLAPPFHAAIAVIGIGGDTKARRHQRVDQGLERPVWDLCQHPHARLTTPRDHPATRWCLCGKRAASPRALEPSASPAPPRLATASGLPWWPATLSTAPHATAPSTVGVGFVATRPWRRCQVMCCPAS